MLKAKNGENKKEWKETKCVSHVNETLIRIAMIYERLRSGEVHADDYFCATFRTTSKNDLLSHVSQTLIFCRNLKNKFNLILVLFCDGYDDDCCRSRQNIVY